MSRYDEVRSLLRTDPRTWLVTGAAGFIGSHLVEALLELDQHVIGLDNFATGRRANLAAVLSRASVEKSARFRFIEADVRDPAACREAARGADYVLHQAALASVPLSIEQPRSTYATNVNGFVNVLLGAVDARRIVYASSSAVYGDDESAQKRESRIGRPLSPYAASKLMGEVMAGAARQLGIESIGLRYFNVFGSRQDPAGAYAAVIPRWIEALFAGEACVVFGDASKSRDFCYVANVVQANLLAACAPSESLPQVVNVACAARTTLRELFDLIRERVARYRPDTARAGLCQAPARSGDIEHSLASIELAQTSLGYEASVGMGVGLDQTVAWYAKRRSRNTPSGSFKAAGPPQSLEGTP